MYNLNYDILFSIANCLDFNNIINFSIINKENYLIFDDLFFTNLAFKMYTVNFWIKALERPFRLSKPLDKIKDELLRIQKFQSILDSYNVKRWSNNDFYRYWDWQCSNNYLKS